jgi:hypothetical protein
MFYIPGIYLLYSFQLRVLKKYFLQYSFQLRVLKKVFLFVGDFIM